MARAALIGIHSVFPLVKITGHKGGKDPISMKKLEKGGATMETSKEVLGFLVNGINRTMQLPAKKATVIIDELSKLLKKKSIPFKRMERIVGKLIHAATILPTSKALLTPPLSEHGHKTGNNWPGQQIRNEGSIARSTSNGAVNSRPSNPCIRIG
jgi:hypothetical protein